MAKNDVIVCRECDKTMIKVGASSVDGETVIKYECETTNCNNYSESKVTNEH